MTTPLSPQDAPSQRIDTVAQRIQGARDALRDNRPVALEGLEDDVESLCLMVREPDYRDRRDVHDALVRLLSDLDTLETELTARRDTLVGPCADNVAANVVTNAYTKTKR